jgi:hypothetical protein
VLQRLSGRGALFRVRVEQAVHEVLRLRGNGRPLRPTHVNDALDDLILQHVLVRVVEWELRPPSLTGVLPGRQVLVNTQKAKAYTKDTLRRLQVCCVGERSEYVAETSLLSPRC